MVATKCPTCSTATTTKFKSSTKKDFFVGAESFTSADGFKIAAAVTSYDRDPQSIEDPEIGKLVFYYKSWDSNDPDVDFGFTEILSEPCSDNAFEDSNRFYPIN